MYVKRVLRYEFFAILEITLRLLARTSLIHRRCGLTKIRMALAIAECSSNNNSKSGGGSGSRRGVFAGRTTRDLVRRLRAVFYVSVRLVRSARYTYFSMRTSEESCKREKLFPYYTTGHRRFPGMPTSGVQETALGTILLPPLCASAIYRYCSRPSSPISPSL